MDIFSGSSLIVWRNLLECSYFPEIEISYPITTKNQLKKWEGGSGSAEERKLCFFFVLIYIVIFMFANGRETLPDEKRAL